MPRGSGIEKRIEKLETVYGRAASLEEIRRELEELKDVPDIQVGGTITEELAEKMRRKCELKALLPGGYRNVQWRVTVRGPP